MPRRQRKAIPFTPLQAAQLELDLAGDDPDPGETAEIAA